MALTQEQWASKLKSLVPSWVFTELNRNEAIFQATAKVLEQAQKDYELHLQESFIDSATSEYLDLHGEERSKSRFIGEPDSSYAERIKLIKNASNPPDIKTIVDAQLVNGVSTIIEHHSAENFLNRNAYLNRNIIDFEVLYNAFTILVYKQVPQTESFMNREAFLSREDFYGSNESNLNIFQNIVSAVNKEKAFGTVYRLIERPNQG